MAAEFARVQYAPSVATHRHVTRILGYDGEIETAWKLPNAANPAFVAPVPADQHVDLQTFFFGKMTHGLTLRPYRPDEGCCPGGWQFDLAADAFSAPFGKGSITATCCSTEVSVQLPTGTMMGTIRPACCGFQPRYNLDWATGENVSYRLPPCTTLCGPWRTGFVGTAPGEEDQHQIRYWDHDGMYITCNMFLLCLPCRIGCLQCCQTCECPDEVGYTTWQPQTLTAIRRKLISDYQFVLQSSFGIPVFETNSDNLPVGVNNTEHLSDINALGNTRMRMRRSCCKWIMSDPTDSSDHSNSSGFDLTFRGTFNQNSLDQKDFALALGYLIMQNYFFMQNLVRAGGNPSFPAQNMPRAMWLLHKADVRPNHAGIGGHKMV